jgi:hypothetical protein
MLDVGIKSREVMIVSNDFRAIHVECLWVWVSIGDCRLKKHVGALERKGF